MLRLVDDATEHTDAAHEPRDEVASVELDELCRLAAQDMIAIALETERRAYLAAHADVVDEHRKRMVVGNGYHRQRRSRPPRAGGGRAAGR